MGQTRQPLRFILAFNWNGSLEPSLRLLRGICVQSCVLSARLPLVFPGSGCGTGWGTSGREVEVMLRTWRDSGDVCWSWGQGEQRLGGRGPETGASGARSSNTSDLGQ